MNEVWMPIAGYEDSYMISNMGRLQSVTREGIWNGYVARNGYMKVSLRGKSRFVHDIVAETFLEKREGCTEVDHIDHNPANNVVTNLRWVSHKENMRNSRANRIVTVDGISKTLSEWAEESDIPYHTIKARLRNGWSEKDAVFKPRSTQRTINTEYTRKPNYNSKLYEFNGEAHTIPEWARILGLNKNTLQSRNHMGWDIEDILTKPIKSKGVKSNGREKRNS